MYNYVLITPARNEEKYIIHTLKSMAIQSTPPLVWVIVSDNSTDRTDEIVKDYEKQYSFIKLLRIESEKKRNFGAQVRAFLKGFEIVKNMQYDFIGNLDADVSFDKDYYQKIIDQFNIDKKLGLAGGYICEEQDGVFNSRKYNSPDSVAHAVQLFRKECYEKIGGYVPLRYGGSDSVAEIKAKMNGWKVKAYSEFEVRHHKPTNGAEGQYKGAFRQGLMDYSIGNLCSFELLKCLYRTNNGFMKSLCRFSGFIWAGTKGNPREVDKDFIKYYREEQRKKMLAKGKEAINHIFNPEPQPKIGS